MKTVLVASNVGLNAKLFVALLTKALKYEVVVIGRGESLEDALAARRFDLVILNRGRDDFRVAHDGLGVPVFVVSSFPVEDDPWRGDYSPQPIQPIIFLMTCARLTGWPATREEITGLLKEGFGDLCSHDGGDGRSALAVVQAPD